MLGIGLTGGIGSGKTTIANLFAEHNVPIIDADKIAREITQPNQPTTAAILDHFGASLALSDGQLDRASIRKIVFNRPAERIWLENLTHPIIRAELTRQMQAVTYPYCIAVIPLLIEANWSSLINRILVVDAPYDEQINRVIARDNAQEEDISAIITNQTSRDNRLAHADDVIVNDGSIDALREQVATLHKKYLSLAK